LDVLAQTSLGNGRRIPRRKQSIRAFTRDQSLYRIPSLEEAGKLPASGKHGRY